VRCGKTAEAIKTELSGLMEYAFNGGVDASTGTGTFRAVCLIEKHEFGVG